MPAPCPLVVDRAKMPPRLTILCATITRVLASVLRFHKGADHEAWKARARSLSSGSEAWRMSNPAILPCVSGRNLHRPDDPLHPFQSLLDRIHLWLMGLAGAAGAVGDRNALKHNREPIKAPELPFVTDIAGLFGCQKMALGRDADR